MIFVSMQSLSLVPCANAVSAMAGIVRQLCATGTSFSVSRQGPSRFRSLSALAVCVMALGSTASAQTAHYSYSEITLGSGFSQPVGVAMDYHGNVYVADQANKAVYQIVAVNGSIPASPVINSLGGGFTAPNGIAVDMNANVYVTDIGANVVYQIPATSPVCSSFGCMISLGGGIDQGSGVAVDLSGNVFVSDLSGNVSLNIHVMKEIPYNCFASNCVVPLSNLINSYGVAVDKNDNLYYADTDQYVYEYMNGCTSTCIAALGPQFSNPYGVAVDTNGDVYVADGGGNDIYEILAVGGSIPSTPTILALGNGVSFPRGVAVDAAENVYVADTNNQRVVELQKGTLNLGTVPIGTTSAVIPITFTFDSGGEILAPLALTMGAQGLDFAVAGGGTCAAGTYSAAATCTVNVTFTPTVSGLRVGSAILQNSSGVTIATARVYGTGSGPQITFPTESNLPSTFTATPPDTVTFVQYNPYGVITLGGGFQFPGQLAVDGSGNVFVADYGPGGSSGGFVKEIPYACTSASCVKAITNSFKDARGVALDGAGNLYVADQAGSSVYEMLAMGGIVPTSPTVNLLGNGTAEEFPAAESVAVDKYGNVFVPTTVNPELDEILASDGVIPASPVVKTVGSGVSADALAIAPNGNIYYTDTGNATVDELLAVNGSIPASPTTTVFGYTNGSSSGFDNPYGAAVDGNGNFYFNDTFDGGTWEFLQVGGSVPAWSATTELDVLSYGSSASNSPMGIAVDGSGNVYLGDTTSTQVTKLDFADPPSLGIVAGGSQSLIVWNFGNQPLTFTSFTTSSPNFTLDETALTACLTSTPLAPQSSCTIVVDMAAASTPLTGTLTLTDNNLNVASNTQVIPLTASGKLSQLVTFTDNLPASVPYSPDISFTLSATGTNSGIPVTFNIQSGPGKISGATLSFTGAGTVWVAAAQAGNATYSAAPGVIQSILVNQAPQTITFPQPTSPVNYGVSPITLSATGGASGNPVVFSVVSGPGGVTGANGSTLSVNGTGEIVIAANQAGNANYTEAMQVTQSIMVNPPLAAAISTPTPGGTLTGSSIIFTWAAAAGASEYYLQIGSTGLGSYNLWNGSESTHLFASVTNLPINGETVYVRLWSLVAGTWLHSDCTYTAFTGVPATMNPPGGGATLGGVSQLFSWNAGVGVTQYVLRIGSTGAGSTNLYNGAGTTTISATVNNLPINGETVYVGLWSLVGGEWLYNNYTYTAFTATPATMSSPSGGATFTSGSQLFTWTAGSGDTNYILRIGSTGAGSTNVYSGPEISATSATVTGLPINGEKLYVGLWSLTGGEWQVVNYTYTAYTSPATMSSPASGSTLGGVSQLFAWNGGAWITDYILRIGSTGPGSSNLYNGPESTNTSVTVSNLPLNGETLYVRLWSLIGTSWKYIDYTYTAFTGTAATISSPGAGATFSGPSQTFTWGGGVGVTGYILRVGSTGLGSSNLYNGAETTALAATVSKLPFNGETVNVRLLSLAGGEWLFNDYTYTAFTGIPAIINSPSASGPLTGPSQLFTWSSGTGVTDYVLRIGSTGPGSTNLYNGPETTAMSVTVNNLPRNGETIYASLWSLTGGDWLFNSYTYTAFTGTPATLTGPSSGALGGTSQLFTWNAGVGVTEYLLRIGSTGAGSSNLYNGAETTEMSATVNNLPSNGETLYVSLWSLTGGVWLYNNYTFTAYTP